MNRCVPLLLPAARGAVPRSHDGTAALVRLALILLGVALGSGALRQRLRPAAVIP